MEDFQKKPVSRRLPCINLTAENQLEVSTSNGEAAIMQEAQPMKNEVKNSSDLQNIEVVEHELLECIEDEDDEKFARILENYRNDLNKPIHDGRLLLHIATAENQTPIVELLLKRGASNTATDRNGNIALYYAIQKNRKKIGRLLLDRDRNKQLQMLCSQGKSLYDWIKEDSSKEYWLDFISQEKNIDKVKDVQNRVGSTKRWTKGEEDKILDFMLDSRDSEQPFGRDDYEKLIEETGIDASFEAVKSKVQWWKKRFLEADKLFKSSDAGKKEKLRKSYPDYDKLSQIFSVKNVVAVCNQDAIGHCYVDLTTIKKLQKSTENEERISNRFDRKLTKANSKNSLDDVIKSAEELRIFFQQLVEVNQQK